MEFFDSHCHLNHPDFHEDHADIWRQSQKQGVTECVVIGFDLASSRNALQLAETHQGLHASIGVSPHDIQAAPKDYLHQLRQLAEHPSCVAIGESGLEYNYDVGPKALQHQFFKEQIQLANECGKPLVIHLRDADEDFLHIIHEIPPKAAILHCFTASETVMQTAVDRGYYISFSGIATFKNAKEIHRLVPQIPDHSLLIETDSPYLAPVPYRGKRCEPWMVTETAKKMAEMRETSFESIAEITRKNARRVFQFTN